MNSDVYFSKKKSKSSESFLMRKMLRNTEIQRGKSLIFNIHEAK